MKNMAILCTLAFLTIPSISCSALDMTVYEHEETRELIHFVLAAAQEIEQQGEEAFPQFREKGGKWFHDSSYIFVWGLDGMRYVYPSDLSGEGKNMLGLEDVNGKSIGGIIVQTAASVVGEGWLHYQWPEPGGTTPIWKSSFVKRAVTPSGKSYAVVSGKYHPKCEKVFIIDLVNQAISLIEKQGLATLNAMREKSSEFTFADSYIFIKDDQGNELLNVAFPEYEGTNVANLQDANGKYYVREVLNTLKFEDDCWVEYMWPKPDKTTLSRKLAYERKIVVDDRTLIVGAGYYPD